MSVELIAEFNAAETWEQALAAIKNTEYFSILIEDAETRAGYQQKLTDLPDDQGREQAIGMGVVQFKALFGPFTSVEDIAEAVKSQIDTEHAKFEFITALDGASTAAEMAAAIKATAGLVNDHRQALVDDLLTSDDDDIVALGNALKSSTFTKSLAEIVKHFDDENFMADVGARMFAARNASVPDGRFYGDGKATTALDSAMDAIDPVYAFNSAGTTDEMVAAIKMHYLALLDDTSEDEFEFIPNGSGRQKAVADGVLEIKKFFGDFASQADLIKALDHQVSVEYNKYVFIQAIDNAADVAGIVTALKALEASVATLNDQRQDLITEWSKYPNNTELAKRVAELKADKYTNALAAVDARLGDAGFIEDLAEALLAARTAAGGRLNSVVTITNIMDSTVDAIDPTYALNSALNTDEMVAAIKMHYVALLDGTSELEFEGIPNGSGRQKAVADGVLEIRKFFGDFASPGKAAEALDHQVSVEYNKYVFIQAIDNAANAAGIAAALVQYVETLNDQRQDLIAAWGAITGNAPLATRVSQLRADTYTKALKAVADRLDNDDFVASLAESLFNARTDAGGRLNSIVTITQLMADGVEELNVPPTAPGTKTVTIDEDNSATAVDIDASDLDGDELTYSVKDTAKPQKGTVTFDQANGTFTYKPAANVNGTDTFTIVVSDGNGATVEQVVTVTINPVNDAPFDITLSNSKVQENSVVGTPVGQLTGFDVDGDALSFALVDNAGGRFALKTENGITSIVVADGFKLDYEQAMFHTIRVRATDSENNSYEETITIDLTDVSGEKLTGTSTSDVLTGNVGNDVLKAGAGNDTISGGVGNDTLYGGSGNDKVRGGIGKDTLKGESGKDTFVFDTKPGKSNVDKVLDFKVKDDSFWLDNAVFTKLGKKGTEANPAKLSKSFFTIGDKAKDKNDYVIYDSKKGKLFYDADGSGKGKQVEIATLSKNLKMTEKDFFIV